MYYKISMKNFYSDIGDCRYRISAKAIIRDENGRFGLALEHTGKYDFPWWGIDHGEYPEQTIVREIQEETWLAVLSHSKTPKYFFVAESTNWKVPLGLVFYEVVVENFKITPSNECQSLDFFTLEEALDANLYNGARMVLERAKKLYGDF